MNAPPRTICGAKTRSGSPCRRSPAANGRCSLHGGKSLVGSQSATFVTGRYSKALPSGILALYEQARTDPDLLNLSDELALLDGRLADLFGRVAEFDPFVLKARLRTLIGDLAELAAEEEPSAAAMAPVVAAMDDAVDEAIAEVKTWREATDLIERRRKLVETETKRRLAGQQVITADQALVMLRVVQQAVDDEVEDQGARRRIALRIRAFVEGDAR